MGLIEEPVTKDSLIDTALALLEALAALCGFVNRERSLVNIDRTAQSLLKETVAVHMQGLDDDKVLEVHLTNARFKALLLEAQFRETSIDLNTYNSCLADIFKTNSYEPIVRVGAFLQQYVFYHLIIFCKVPARTSYLPLRPCRCSHCLQCRNSRTWGGNTTAMDKSDQGTRVFDTSGEIAQRQRCNANSSGTR